MESERGRITHNPAPGLVCRSDYYAGVNFNNETSEGGDTMDTLTRHYETTFIINATLDDAQTEGVITRVQEILLKNEGTVTAVEKWGRKRLAYPIQKKNNGFYVVLLFSAKGNAVAKLERHYQLDENIIRYLTVQLDAKALNLRRSVARAEEEPAAAPVQQELQPSEAIADPQAVAVTQ